MHKPIRMVAALLCLVLAGPLAARQGAGEGERVQPEVVKLQLAIDGRNIPVVTHLYKPHGAGPHPLVIYLHGRAGTDARRAELDYPIPVGHGNYWLRKGVAVVAPVRPGYGQTGGPDVENSGSRWKGNTCVADPDFTRAATNARRTALATYQWALRQPWVRKDRILIEGQSVGGMTAVATAALNLPGVVGIVNFAGGGGGYPEVSPGKSCKPGNLTETYRQFGRQARRPSLWLYAQNDQYWGPDMPRAWHQAYKAGGSDAVLIQTGPLEGRDGHQLLLHGGRMWAPPLDAFVRRVGLTAP